MSIEFVIPVGGNPDSRPILVEGTPARAALHKPKKIAKTFDVNEKKRFLVTENEQLERNALRFR